MIRALRLALGLWFALVSTLAPAHATTGALDTVLLGKPGWAKGVVDLDFANGRYWLQGATGPLAVTRASLETCLDAAGNLYQVGNNQPCIAPGVGVGAWEGRTNGVPNNTMQGAVAGTPGTPPTGWIIVNTFFGISTQIVGTGTELGINYIDVRIFGTATASSAGAEIIRTSGNQSIAATYGQTWISTEYIYLVSGSLTGVANLSSSIVPANSAGTELISYLSPIITAGIAPLGFNISKKSQTLLPATTAYVVQRSLQFDVVNTTVYDFTLRIGLPQLELNPNIPATVASAVTAASGASGVNGTAVYSVAGGTCSTAPQLNVTWAAGVMTVNSVANAGSCSVLPPSPATLAYVSGAATGWSGATVTLTPTDNSAQAFATPPILTSGTAQTRAADQISIPISGGYSVLAYGSTNVPNTSAKVQTLAELDSGSFSTLTQLARGTNSNVYCSAGVSGTFVTPVPASPSWGVGTSKRMACLTDGTNASVTFNGAGKTSIALAAQNNASFLRIGGQIGGASPWNGYVSRVVESGATPALLFAGDPWPANDNRRFADLGAFTAAPSPAAAQARRFARAA